VSGRWVRWLYAIPIVLIVGAFAFKIFQPVTVLPRIRLAPAFAFVDENGERLTSEDLRGKVTVYTFSYAGCGEGCSDPNQTMQTIRAALMEQPFASGTDLVFVTISFDPAHDTPEALDAYARRWRDPDDGGPAWHFVTLPDADLLKTIIGRGFEVYYQQRADGGFDFDPVYIIVDGWGVIRGEYRYQTWAAMDERIIRHLYVLDDEIMNSKGAARLAYEAAHLFLCYP
jgi:protein SCO1/2